MVQTATRHGAAGESRCGRLILQVRVRISGGPLSPASVCAFSPRAIEPGRFVEASVFLDCSVEVLDEPGALPDPERADAVRQFAPFLRPELEVGL